MQTIKLTINKEIQAIGNIPIPSGSIVNIALTRINFGDVTSVDFQSAVFSNQVSLEAKEPVMVKGLNESGPRGNFFNFGLSIKADDFTLETDTNCCLTESSLDSAKEKIKVLLVENLEGIVITDIT